MSDDSPLSPVLDDASASSGIEQRITSVGEGLASSLRRVLDALPDRPRRPNQLAQMLGLNRDISGRVLSATESTDPLTVTHVIPGPEPLRKLIRAARKKRVDADILEAAETAIREFELLIREAAGDRPALDAIISSLSPTTRGRFELAARQTIFKGTSLLKGVMADMWLHTAFVHPSNDDSDHHDVAYLYGTLGLRRVRPNMQVKFTYQQFGTDTKPCQSLDGRPFHKSDGTELDPFCALPPARLNGHAAGNGTIHVLAGNAVGPQSACDKLLSEVRPKAMNRYAAARPRNKKSLFVAPGIPVKLLVFDLLLHEDVFPAAQPMLVMYDTTVDGMASVNDPARDADRLETTDTISFLGHGSARFSLNEMPRYIEMLRFACERRDWNLDEFRAYRCIIQYPMHGSQACMMFDAPPRPPG